MNKPLLVLFLLILSSLAGYSQTCTLNVTVSSTTTIICSGNNVTLNANITGGTGPFTYIWSTGENTASIDVNKAGTYTVTVSDKTPGCQPKVASLEVTAVASPNPPAVVGQVVCPNTSATLTATSPGGTYQWYDANGNFLFTGNPYVTDPVTQATLFYVQTTVGSCTSTRSAVIVNVTGRPSIQADPVCYGTPATLIATGADSYAWYANASGTGTPLSNDPTFITPALFQNTTYYLFSVIKGCSNSGIPVVARINTPPTTPVVGPGTSVCVGSPITLHADASGVVEWFDSPSGGVPLISSPDFTTPALTSPVTYYVQNRVGDCTSNRIAVPVSVTPIPAAPPSQSPVTCFGTSITLTADASPTGTYAWYVTATGGTPVATGNTFSTPVLTGNTTYYVERSNGSCTSDRTPVTVTITPNPEPPIVPDGPVICNGTPTMLTATSTGGGTFQWFNTATGGTALANGATFTTPNLTATTTYYVQTTEGACISDRAAITVTVLDALPAPVPPPTVNICPGTSATLTVTGSPDDYEWYDQATGGTLLITGNTYVTPDLTANTTYYVQSIANGCSGPRTAVTVHVNVPPAAPNVTGPTSVCPGQAVTLNANPAAGETIQWFVDATGGTLIQTGNTYNTAPLTTETTFYVQAVNGSCVSARTPFTVSLTPTFNPQFRYPSGTICTSGSNVKPDIYNPGGGIFSSSPAGLVFVSKTTGEINVAASAVGKYNINFAFTGTCAGSINQSVSIVTTPDATFSYNTPFCTDMANPLPVFAGTASAGVFSEPTGKLVFKNTSTGEIDLSNSQPGTYTVTNTIAASSGCAQSIVTGTVTIYDEVSVNAGPNQTVAQGDPVQLGGSIKRGITTGRWSGGAGTFSDPTDKAAVYTPAPNETSVTLTLTSDNPAGPCGAKLSRLTITINPKPAVPTAADQQVCIGSTVTLQATAPGGTYKWYSTATGGTALKVGPIFTTPPVLSDVTYYVATTVGGITSNRKAVLVHATDPPAAPVVSGATTVCEGQPATLTASGSTGTYTWYNLPLGGSPIKLGSTFSSAPLTIGRKYYVETKVNDCVSARTPVEITVTPAPNVTSSAIGNPICSGTALNYTITADQPGATFTWERLTVPGISNPEVTGQTTNTITETLINTKGTAIDVTYNITPYLNGCPGPVSTYKVTVNAMPVIVSDSPAPICNGTSTGYQVQFNTPSTSYTWSRDAVPNITNAAISGQAAPTIKEVLFNTGTTPIDVTYVFNYKTSDCTGGPSGVKVTVNPEVLVTNTSPGPPVCNNTPLGLTLTSNIQSATFLWSRDAVPGISNPAVTNQTGNTINEALVNIATVPLQVSYIITPMAFGCAGTPFKYDVVVRPETLQASGRSNSPVCEGNPILLLTTPVSGAQYLWTGPNNYQSTDANPIIPNATAANAGRYSLTLIMNNCPGEPSPVDVEINPIPVVDAGPAQQQCVSVPFIQLAGNIPTVPGTGIWSSVTGGTFSKQDDLQAQYFPSAADRAAGSVTITLTATGKSDCVKPSKQVTITFAPSPGADAGPPSIDNVCNQNPMVPLTGQVFSGSTVKWTSASGLGKFIPSDESLTPTFEPDPIDIAKGSVKLTLRATQADDCHLPTDDITINFVPPPTVQADAAGSIRYVLKDHTITLNPVVSNENVTYEWTPSTNLDNSTTKNPVVTGGDQDITYQLKITDPSNGCVNYSQVTVKVSPVITVSNTFTPNGDGINDYWEIKGLVAYENCTVDVYNRYGQPLFHAVGYPKPWDGTYQGKAMPSGTYYYVINTKMNTKILSGYVVILR